ncbi:CYTH and CHAD domain-containing protein [Kitasatospora sp. NPDC001539]|uniref:CYTH and CHAD domain-containing protein n=1 Tax=Kitasatospora sp. NPDC001539 TaxID=3154384 RepID=UPI003334616C
MGTQHVETERKYDGAALPRLDRLPGVAAVRDAAPQDLDAVYYDTADLRLLRRHITVRRRGGGEDAGWHLKLPRTGDEREEVRLPAPPGGGEVPAELVRLVAAFTRGAALVPVAHLRTHRRRVLLRDEREEVLAQVTEDRVAAQALGVDGGSTTEVGGWTEFEVELDHGTPELLDRVEAVFTDAGLARSPWPSKLARALDGTRAAGAGSAPRVAAQAPGSAGALVMDGFRAQLEALLALDAAVRLGRADSVHQMRITARRLRSLLKAHRRLFRRGSTEAPAAELRRLGRLLGRARDQEVLGETLVDQLDAVPARLRRGALRGRLTERYAQGYRTAWRQVVAELDGARYYALLERLDAFAADPPLRRRRAGRDARRYAREVLRREQRRTLKRLDRALGLEPGPRRDLALHGARKAAKRARYTADHAQSQVPRRSAKRAARFAGRMKDLHKVLGAHQDSVVARQELIALEGREAGAEQDAFAYGVLHERQRHAAEAAQRRLPELRRRAGRRKLTRL